MDLSSVFGEEHGKLKPIRRSKPIPPLGPYCILWKSSYPPQEEFLEIFERIREEFLETFGRMLEDFSNPP